MKRRRFLRGVGGVALGLPLLESLGARRFSRAAVPPPERRFVVFFTCNGIDRRTFYPTGEPGPLTPERLDTAKGLGPLRDHADALLVVRNLHQVPKGWDLYAQPGCDHQRGMGCKLTAQPLDPESDEILPMGESVDHHIARRLEPDGREPMTLMVGPESPTVHGLISYRGPGDPIVPDNDPWSVFEDLVAGGRLGLDARSRLLERRESILDLVREDLDEIARAPLSRDDREKVDLHFTTMRELELDLESLRDDSVGAEIPSEVASVRAALVETNDHHKTVGRAQMKLLAMALASGRHRVASLMWGTGAKGPIFRWDGMAHEYNHHKLSHGNTSDHDDGDPIPDYLDLVAEIDRWHAGELAHLLDLLDGYHEGEHGSVLDQSAVLWINELSEGRTHDFKDLPVVIAGGAAGRLDTGRYVNATGGPLGPHPEELPDSGSHDKLLNTLINVVTRGDDDPRTLDFGHPDNPGGELRGLERG